MQRRFLRKRGAAGKRYTSAPSSDAARHLPPVGEGFSDDGKVLAKAQSFRVRPLPRGELSRSD